MKKLNGKARFEFYLKQLEQIITKAAEEKNPALYLYSNGARTPLFMLEGLARLYSEIHDKKKFSKLKYHFKLLEDEIGAVDYYDNMAKDFLKDAAIPSTVTAYLQAQTREKLQRVNDILTQEKWIGNRLSKIRKKLEEADWEMPEEEVNNIFNFYKSSIEEIHDFMKKNEAGFKELETGAHAMRRKLRWLSIYPQALQGIVQLKDNGIADEKTTKYLIPDIVNSPFNKMPGAGENAYFILFEKKYFLALSWVIAALGRIKDNGLRILAAAEALQQAEGIDHNNAVIKASNFFGGDEQALQKILDEATSVCKTFFEEGDLDKMLIGVAKAY